MYKLENWSVGFCAKGGYEAPELISTRLMGEVYDHPDFEDGDTVTTSSVIEVDGNVVTTRHGGTPNKYRLGKIDPKYKKWLDKNNIPYDPKNPVKLG